MNRVITLLACTFISINAFPLGGVLNGKSASKDDFKSDPIRKKIIKMGGYGLKAYIKKSDDGEFYVILGSAFGALDLKNNKYLGTIDLPRWPQELKDKTVASMYQLRSDKDYAKKYLYRPFPSFDPNFKQPPVMGCLAETPLRYGDVDGNKTEEVVLLLGHEDDVLDFVLFNPEKEKISFSARVIMSDIDDYHGDASQYQYTSNHNMSKGEYIGTQTFAKVFMGEFDGFESNKDIIVWRKHYQSKTTASLIKGFELVSESYQFYTLKDGEYVLQISLESQIEQWMSDENLTWQKGFPTQSECAGQEGQLIPEMHDALLNDPDVLK